MRRPRRSMDSWVLAGFLDSGFRGSTGAWFMVCKGFECFLGACCSGF